MKVTAKRYDRRDVIAVAWAIFREAGNKIVREGEVSSRDRLDQHFNGSAKIAVTNEDFEQADTVLSYVQQRTTMNALTGAKVAAFVVDVIAITEKDTISERDFGRIVWLPKLYTDMVGKDDVKQELAHFTVSSKFVGKIKDKLSINFTPISVSYNRDYGCWRHLGHDGNGNLIGFLNKNQMSGAITGRVKKQENSRYNGNAKVTYLNYVQGVKNGS
jgi:hypothetical protein